MTDHQLRQTRYGEFLASRGLRFGFAEEIAALANRTRAGVSNDTPPVERWHRIVPTVLMVERLREKFGPTVINSAYRSTAYNLAVGGVGDSRHAQNDAIDCHCATGTPAEWGAFVRELRASGLFTGGVGVYPRQRFVHIDTRGTVADWVGR